MDFRKEKKRRQKEKNKVIMEKRRIELEAMYAANQNQNMADQPDPLSILRQYNVNKMEIITKKDNIIFGEFSWPKKVKTNYLVSGSGKDGAPKNYYSLECLLFFLKHLHLRHPLYVREAAIENVPAVRRPDRKDLLGYLQGQIPSAFSIDKSAPLEIPTQVKHTVEDTSDSPVKKPRLDNSDVQKLEESDSLRFDAPKTGNIDRQGRVEGTLTVKMDKNAMRNQEGTERTAQNTEPESHMEKDIKGPVDSSRSEYVKIEIKKETLEYSERSDKQYDELQGQLKHSQNTEPESHTEKDIQGPVDSSQSEYVKMEIKEETLQFSEKSDKQYDELQGQLKHELGAQGCYVRPDSQSEVQKCGFPDPLEDIEPLYSGLNDLNQMI